MFLIISEIYLCLFRTHVNIYTSDDDFNHKHFAYLKREVKGIKKEYYSNDK